MFTAFKGDNEAPDWSLTPNELRSHKGLECLTDAQAEKIIVTLVRLALIAYNVS